MNLKTKPDKLLASLRDAMALHNQGRLDEADSIYRKVLQQSPGHPDAMHLRALVCHAKEQFVEAAKLAEAAISAAPRVANLHNTAGEAWRRQGQLEKARKRLSEAIRLDPAMAMAHHNLSLVCSAEARHTEARQCNQQALKLNPGHVDAVIQSLEIACALNDEAQVSEGVRQLQNFAGNPLAAAAIARYHVRAARQLLSQLRFAEADQAAAAAIAASPEFWGGWALRGEAHFEQLKLAEAELFCTMAAHLAPQNENARLNLSVLLKDQKRVAEAAAHLDDWLADHPENPDARFSRAGIALMQGDYAAGWADYEARWQLPSNPSRFAGAPLWAGQTVNRLLLYAEQGLGDSVQMLRFLPEVNRLCPGGVVLQVPPALLRLTRRVFGAVGLTVTSELPTTPFDAACPLMSLPLMLRVNSTERLLGQAAYLSADPARTAEFSTLLSRQPGKKLGIVWRGAEGSRANRLRTLPEAALLPLLDLPGWTPVSLQFGVTAPTIASRKLLDLSAEITDFEDLAAAMMAVDAVVSLDTGPAHLAAALGVSTHTLLPWLHDWRWGLAGERCAWYASMRLYRQPLAGSWNAPIAQLAQTLAGLPAPVQRTTLGVVSTTDNADEAPQRTILGNHFPLVRAECRYGSFTLPLFDRYITRSMLAYGEYSPREAEVLCSYLRPGDCALDVGANLGTLTLAMARAVGPGGRVIALEPQAMIHHCLTQTVRDSATPWVDARRQAAGAVAGSARMGRSNAAHAENFGGRGLVESGDAEEVEMIRLDDLKLDACRLIKIDVEGLELQVLQGASKLLTDQRPVLCVECDRPGTTESLAAFLRGFGYRVYKHQPALFAPRNFRNFSADLFPGLVSGNLLALPPGDTPPADATAI